MWVTLYTDASVGNDGAAWAAWLRCDLGRLVHSGAFAPDLFPPNKHDSTLAEILAILEGVRIGREHWKTASGFLVRTDSQAAADILRYRAPPHRRADFRAAQERLRSLLAPDIKIRTTWIPGHQKPDHTKAWINDRVDALARGARGRRGEP